MTLLLDTPLPLLAQALCEGITLVTVDARLARYPGPVRKV